MDERRGSARSMLARLRHRLSVGRDRRRRTWYDGSERPDPTPPTRYARGKKAVPMPPPPNVF